MEALRLERVRHFCLFCTSTSIGKSNGIFQRKGDLIRTLRGRIMFAVKHFCSNFGAVFRKFLFFRCSIAVFQNQAACGI